MWKKFIAVMAIVGLLSTNAAALDIGGGSSGGSVVSYIDGYAVSPTSFNPSAGATATVSFTLAAAANVDVHAVDSAFQIYEIYGSGVDPYTAATAGNLSYTWYGKVGNTATGAALADGTYTVKAYALSDTGAVLDTDSQTVTLANTTVVAGPVVSGLSADPLEFSPSASQDTEISFDVDKDAYVSVAVKRGTTIVKSFEDYDGTKWYRRTATHSINWDGTDDADEVVSVGVYTLSVTATNDDGSNTSTFNVSVVEAGTLSDGVIEDLILEPSVDWDPTEEELQIEFELTSEVNSLTIDAKQGNRVIEILDEEDADDGDYTEFWDGTDDDGDYVKGGIWEIIVRADGDVVKGRIEVQFGEPEVTQALVTKESFDPSEDEFTTLLFKADANAVATVEVYKGSKREFTLLDEETVRKNRWYAVSWDGFDADGDEVEYGKDWKFKLTVEDATEDKNSDTVIVEIDVEADEVSDSKSNVTNDYVAPVAFDDEVDSAVVIPYCLDEDAEVFIAIYEGPSASGKAEIELLDYLDQSAGCHEVEWTGRDEDNKTLKDGIYSYKIISKANGNHKDTETGHFAIGTAGELGSVPTPPTPPKPPEPTDDCGGYWDSAHFAKGDAELCEALTWVTETGIFNGYGDGSFKPYNNINRAEVLKVLLGAFDNAVILPTDGTTQGFNDLDGDAWYMPYVRSAVFYGMMNGYPDGSARLNNNINRVELLKLALEASNSFTGYYLPTYTTSYYTDVIASENPWYLNYAGVAYAYQLFNEYYDGGSAKYSLHPADLVQRGEVALLLYRMEKFGLLDNEVVYESDVFYESEMAY